MKILVLGSYYSDNLGDGVICECVAEQLRRHFPDAEIVIYDVLDRQQFGREENLSMQLLSSTMRMEANQKQIERIRSMDCDIAVFAGGQLLMDSCALIVEGYLRMFQERGIPVFLNACGTGPTVSEQVRSRLSAALLAPCVKLISCRDDVELLNQLYLNGQKAAVETFDPALWSSQCYQVQRVPASHVVGLGVMFPDTEKIAPQSAASFWMKLIRLLDRRGIPWKIFVNGGASDLTFAQSIYSRLGKTNRTMDDCFARVPNTPKELVEILSQFSGIVSFRLHSHIIAASLGIPSIAICWDDKVRFFFEKLGHPERCCTAKETVDTVFRKLEQAMGEGTDSSRLEAQRQFQDELLYQAIRKELADGQGE